MEEKYFKCRGDQVARDDEYSLLLLAGGKSSRMGSDKADLMLEGKSFLEHMLNKARALGLRRFFISGHASSSLEVESVWDHFSDRGPLGGIHACMKVMDTPYCLVLPVDAPGIPLEILEELLSHHEHSSNKQDVLIWEHGDRKEPLIAIYPVAMVPMIEELICRQSAPVFRALEKWGFACRRIELMEDQIINVNTLELYQKLLQGNHNPHEKKEWMAE